MMAPCAILLLLFAVSSSFADDNVFSLDGNTFQNYIRDKEVMLVDFYAPWCTHCQHLAPELENAAKMLESKQQYVFAKVDCTLPQNVQLCKNFNVQGYPTLKLFRSGTFTGDYIGERNTNALVNYMDSVSETSRQNTPLTTNGPGSFAAQLGANPQAYVNPQQVQIQPVIQPYGMGQQQGPVNAGSYFHVNNELAGANTPSMQSFYHQPNSYPATATAAYANQQPIVEVHAPKAPLHLGASPDSLAGKFGGNMLALEILRSKLKMIAAYKNWQKRLKEYKIKMTEASERNPYIQNRAAAKHVIHKPVKVKPPKTHYQTSKYPRTFQRPVRPPHQSTLFEAEEYRRSNALKRLKFRYSQQQAAYHKRLAAYKKKKLATYKRYYEHPQQQQQQQELYQAYSRSDIARPQTAQTSLEAPPATMFQPQPQYPVAQPEAQFAVNTQPEAQFAANTQPEAQFAANTQPEAQFANTQPEAQFANTQPQPQYPVAQPEAQVAATQPEAQIPADQPQSSAPAAQPEAQVTATQPEAQVTATQPQPQIPADQPQSSAPAAQPEAQVTATQPEAQVTATQPEAQVAATLPEAQIPADQPQSSVPAAQPESQVSEPKVQADNDVPHAAAKQQSSNNDASISELKHDIENAIQDALKNTNESNSETKPAVKPEPKVQTKVLDITSGSGSGSGSNVVGGQFTDMSGSGSISGSGSGEAVSNKSNDKASGEA